MVNIKRLRYKINKLMIGIVFLAIPIFSNTIKVDEETNVYVEKASNGVKVVNISTPSEKGNNVYGDSSKVKINVVEKYR